MGCISRGTCLYTLDSAYRWLTRFVWLERSSLREGGKGYLLEERYRSGSPRISGTARKWIDSRQGLILLFNWCTCKSCSSGSFFRWCSLYTRWWRRSTLSWYLSFRKSFRSSWPMLGSRSNTWILYLCSTNGWQNTRYAIPKKTCLFVSIIWIRVIRRKSSLLSTTLYSSSCKRSWALLALPSLQIVMKRGRFRLCWGTSLTCLAKWIGRRDLTFRVLQDVLCARPFSSFQ